MKMQGHFSYYLSVGKKPKTKTKIELKEEYLDLLHLSSVVPNAIAALSLPLEVIIVFWRGHSIHPLWKLNAEDCKQAFKKNEQGT